MKINLTTCIVALLLMSSCGPTAPKTEKNKIEIRSETVKVDGPAKTVADISIKGMACEMSCVSKINQTLTELKGVKSTAIDFETEREVDKATIEFDPTVISAEDMISAIQGLYDGQYEVTEVALRKEEPM